MALIHCPECGREISDQAAACPGCGYPLSKQNTHTKDDTFLEASRQRDRRFLRIAGPLLLVGIALLLLFAFLCGRQLL